MITKLSIRNFQSHANSEIRFSEGINVIVGSSDSGKTAILRSIKWLLENRPLGDSYIKQGEKECFVRMETKKGIISRLKGKDNYYEVNSGDFNNIYRAFGSGVPDDISDVLSVSNINWHSQLDGPYLVLESGGEIAKELNRSLNLDLIDSCVSVCNSNIRGMNKELKYFSERRDKTKEELDLYKDLDSITDEIKKLEVLNKELNSKIKIYDSLKELLIDIFAIEGPLESEIYDEEDLSSFLKISEELKRKMDYYLSLKELADLLLSCEESILEKDKLIKNCDVEIKNKKKLYEETLDQLELCPFCGRDLDWETSFRISQKL